ncbi:adenosylcobinamide amidohydrolase [Streptomyces sp. CNQ085]|uniref:adenosylcobinamide amidohydrolase n=1 Tax=Streptomyces sp. CNQ085 TaxID=2886944 RepID=UPI0035B3F80F
MRRARSGTADRPETGRRMTSRAPLGGGIGERGWAAAPGAGRDGPPPAGTVNILVSVPAALPDTALVNAVATATEAKGRALPDAGWTPRAHRPTRCASPPRRLRRAVRLTDPRRSRAPAPGPSSPVRRTRRSREPGGATF